MLEHFVFPPTRMKNSPFYLARSVEQQDIERYSDIRNKYVNWSSDL